MTARYGSPEYLAARKEAIARIVAEAPPLNAKQLQTLRRIFASTATPRNGSKNVRPAQEAA